MCIWNWTHKKTAKCHERETMGAWACPVVTINIFVGHSRLSSLTGILSVFDFIFGSIYPCYLFLSAVARWYYTTTTPSDDNECYLFKEFSKLSICCSQPKTLCSSATQVAIGVESLEQKHAHRKDTGRRWETPGESERDSSHGQSDEEIGDDNNIHACCSCSPACSIFHSSSWRTRRPSFGGSSPIGATEGLS